MEIDDPVAPAKQDSLDAVFCTCTLVFPSSSPTPTIDFANIPPPYSPSAGNVKFPNSETSFKVPIFFGALLLSMDSLKQVTFFMPLNEIKKIYTLCTIYHHTLCNLYETLYSVNLYILYSVLDTVAMVLMRTFEKKTRTIKAFLQATSVFLKQK